MFGNSRSEHLEKLMLVSAEREFEVDRNFGKDFNDFCF